MSEGSFVPDPLADADALLAEGRAAEAVVLLDGLVAAGRGGVLTRLALARALAQMQRFDEAHAQLREAALLAPDVTQVAITSGEVLRLAEKIPAAIGELQRALRLDPRSGAAYWQLGLCWLAAGETDKAKDALARAGELEAVPAEDVAARIAEADALAAAPRSAAPYVRHLFDQFAADYDERMRGPLSYRAPEILLELFQLVAGPRRNLRVLDLGCGTGLCGAAFRPLARTLAGVDLSPDMIARACTLGLYDALQVGDIEAFPHGDGAPFDLILAADVFVYLGDLRPVLTGARRQIVADGLLLFTAEAHNGDGYALGPTRRWRHSEAYLRAVAAQCGFDIAGLMPCVPRVNAGIPVAGFAVALRPAS